MPHLIISDEQIEGIVRFYAASATCQGDKLKWTPTCQGTNCGARMFPGFLLQFAHVPIFGRGATFGWPSPSPTGALSPAGSGDAAQWAAPITDRRGSGDQALNGAHWAPAPPKGGGETWLPLWGRYVPVGRCPAADRGGSRDAGAVRRLRGQGAAGRERRGKAPVSLAFFYALRAYKVKGKVAPF